MKLLEVHTKSRVDDLDAFCGVTNTESNGIICQNSKFDRCVSQAGLSLDLSALKLAALRDFLHIASEAAQSLPGAMAVHRDNPDADSIQAPGE